MQSAQTKITFSLEDTPKQIGWCTLRRFNHEVIEVKTSEMPDYHITEKQINSCENKLTKKFSTIEQVDVKLKQSQNEDAPADEEEPNPFEWVMKNYN